MTILQAGDVVPSPAAIISRLHHFRQLTGTNTVQGKGVKAGQGPKTPRKTISAVGDTNPGRADTMSGVPKNSNAKADAVKGENNIKLEPGVASESETSPTTPSTTSSGYGTPTTDTPSRKRARVNTPSELSPNTDGAADIQPAVPYNDWLKTNIYGIKEVYPGDSAGGRTTPPYTGISVQGSPEATPRRSTRGKAATAIARIAAMANFDAAEKAIQYGPLGVSSTDDSGDDGAFPAHRRKVNKVKESLKGDTPKYKSTVHEYEGIYPASEHYQTAGAYKIVGAHLPSKKTIRAHMSRPIEIPSVKGVNDGVRSGGSIPTEEQAWNGC